MTYRVGILAALAALGLTAGADAQGVRVERSGDTYYKSACAPVVGTAMRCHAKVVTDRAGHLIEGRLPPISGYAPADLRDAYKISATGSSSTIVAIVDAFGYDNAEADLAVYRAQWGLPACTTDNGCFKKLNEKGEQGNYPAQDIGWAEESALDLDMASAMCPNCTLYLMEAKTNSANALAKTVAEAALLGAHVISNSYGGHEGRNTKLYAPYYDQPGVAVTASTGDSGFGVQSPADMRTVIAVGGTHLVRNTSDRGWVETVWSGAGSGCSDKFKKPKWQLDTGCSKRTIGDVSADADPATGVAVYGPNQFGNSTWLKFGGTSVSAPMIGGIFGANGGAVHLASTIYADPADLFDVTTGSNGTCSPAYLCTGEVGYDGPTGMGTPNGIGAFGN